MSSTLRQTLLCVIALLGMIGTAALAAASDEKLTANLLRAALDKPIGRSWKSVPIREVIRELSDTTRVSILIDRHLDPSTELTLLAKPQPLRDLIAAAARAVNAESTPVGHVVYVGSPAAVATLLMTQPISHGSFPVNTFSAMALKFDPRPERRIPRIIG